MHGLAELIAAIAALIVAIVAWKKAFSEPHKKRSEGLLRHFARTRSGADPAQRLHQLTAGLVSEVQRLLTAPAETREITELVWRTTQEYQTHVRDRVRERMGQDRQLQEVLEHQVRDRVRGRMEQAAGDDTIEHITIEILEQLRGRIRESVTNQFAASGEQSVGGPATALLDAPDTRHAIDRAIDKMAESPRSKHKRWWLSVSVSFGIVSSLFFAAFLWPEWPDARPRNEYLTTRAFLAFGKGRWKDAKEYAQECITEYEHVARHRQDELEKQKAPLPSLRDVSEQNKQRIFQEGLVNDVAASYWILGRASEKLGETDEAIAAYTQAATFTYAAVWDPRGTFFWCPAEDAAARVSVIELAEKQGKRWPAEKEVTHETLTAAAWESFNKKDYEDAIRYADLCAKQFRQTAEELQEKLTKAKASLPIGAATEEDKQRVFANGPLNDVATCLFIRGRSSEGVQRVKEAKQAYLATMKYTFARCWDPAGWFWSPAEAASDRLARLK